MTKKYSSLIFCNPGNAGNVGVVATEKESLGHPQLRMPTFLYIGHVTIIEIWTDSK